ncbi:hypothetical protein MZE22_24540, partial [Escherichia coli]|nr:hypothetical protein [Escherichia coli]MCK2526936.1 hypothetical protein [Escherichia coli]
YGQLLAFTDCSGYTTRYEYDRYGQQIAVHREEGISTYSSYNPRGQLVSQKDAQGREIRYEYSAAGDLCVFRSIRSRIGIEVRSAIRIHSINR